MPEAMTSKGKGWVIFFTSQGKRWPAEEGSPGEEGGGTLKGPLWD